MKKYRHLTKPSITIFIIQLLIILGYFTMFVGDSNRIVYNLVRDIPFLLQIYYLVLNLFPILIICIGLRIYAKSRHKEKATMTGIILACSAVLTIILISATINSDENWPLFVFFIGLFFIQTVTSIIKIAYHYIMHTVAKKKKLKEANLMPEEHSK